MFGYMFIYQTKNLKCSHSSHVYRSLSRQEVIFYLSITEQVQVQAEGDRGSHCSTVLHWSQRSDQTDVAFINSTLFQLQTQYTVSYRVC